MSKEREVSEWKEKYEESRREVMEMRWVINLSLITHWHWVSFQPADSTQSTVIVQLFGLAELVQLFLTAGFGMILNVLYLCSAWWAPIMWDDGHQCLGLSLQTYILLISFTSWKYWDRRGLNLMIAQNCLRFVLWILSWIAWGCFCCLCRWIHLQNWQGYAYAKFKSTLHK